ncbi:MAG: cell division protein ZapA [Burkholderiales bacterium]|nr:cell division protein ZapA [Burkholderiales bacterium]
MKQIEVQIMGQGYLLSCPEGGEAMLLQAVSRVDAAMCKIRDAGKVKARDRISVLASLNLAFELSEALAKAQSAASLPAPTAAPSAPLPSGESEMLMRELMQRVDTALGADGQLL